MFEIEKSRCRKGLRPYRYPRDQDVRNIHIYRYRVREAIVYDEKFVYSQNLLNKG